MGPKRVHGLKKAPWAGTYGPPKSTSGPGRARAQAGQPENFEK